MPSGAQRGKPKPAGSGRKPGTPNKRTIDLREQLDALGMGKTFDHPIAWMTKVYAGQLKMQTRVTGPTGNPVMADIPASPEIRARCAAEVAEYLEPKRKSLDVGMLQQVKMEIVTVARCPACGHDLTVVDPDAATVPPLLIGEALN